MGSIAQSGYISLPLWSLCFMITAMTAAVRKILQLVNARLVVERGLRHAISKYDDHYGGDN